MRSLFRNFSTGNSARPIWSACERVSWSQTSIRMLRFKSPPHSLPRPPQQISGLFLRCGRFQCTFGDFKSAMIAKPQDFRQFLFNLVDAPRQALTRQGWFAVPSTVDWALGWDTAAPRNFSQLQICVSSSGKQKITADLVWVVMKRTSDLHSSLRSGWRREITKYGSLLSFVNLIFTSHFTYMENTLKQRCSVSVKRTHCGP